MTVEERAAAFVRAWEAGGIPRGGLAVALVAAFRVAEVAAAARQRAADAARAASWMNAIDREMAAALGEFILSGSLETGGRP